MAMSDSENSVRKVGLNTLSPSSGSRRRARRVGRGIGSGYGKTAGRGHKGQNSRSGGGPPVGFEGGQTALHMRLPKFGFSSRKARITDQIRLHELNQVQDERITLESLRAAGLINKSIRRVRIMLRGSVERAFTVVAEGDSIVVTAGARKAIEAAGGAVEVVAAPSVEKVEKAEKVAKAKKVEEKAQAEPSEAEESQPDASEDSAKEE